MGGGGGGGGTFYFVLFYFIKKKKLPNNPLCFHNTSGIETGLSDFHKLCVTTMRATFQKQTPKILNYRNYRYFNNEIFRNDLLKELSKMAFSNISCEAFERLFMKILNKHAPMNKRYIRANNSPFMTNTIYKAIMLRSKLRNKFRRLKTIEFREGYKRQRNICVSLIRDAKKSFYENLNPKHITDNRKFWGQVKPFFSNKTPKCNNITFIEKK